MPPSRNGSVCNAGRTAVREDANAITGLEGLVSLLDDCKQCAAVEFDSYLNTGSTRRALLDRLARNPASHSAQHCGNVRAAAAADRAAGDTTNHRASSRANDGPGAFNLHLAHAFHDTHAHILLTPRFVTGIGTATKTLRTTGEH